MKTMLSRKVMIYIELSYETVAKQDHSRFTEKFFLPLGTDLYLLCMECFRFLHLEENFLLKVNVSCQNNPPIVLLIFTIFGVSK